VQALVMRESRRDGYDSMRTRTTRTNLMNQRNMKLKTAIASLLLLASTGCVVVGGYSSGRGFWIWPGTFVILVIALILFLLFRRRG
jgi:fatty acid desaturase